jgi:hypothetical protein
VRGGGGLPCAYGDCDDAVSFSIFSGDCFIVPAIKENSHAFS